MNTATKTVLWWGRFDPDYSRNRILRQAYAALGWKIADFQPFLSPLGDLEARLRRPARADLVHVPCFRQRDIAAAARYARRQHIPLLIDPLISAYDKQVFERAKFPADSARAKRLLHSENRLMQNAGIVLADTPEHVRFFTDTLGVERAKLHVVYVGAEEPLFFPTAMDGGRFGLLPSRGITPSMEGRSAGREAVPTGTNAGAVFRPAPAQTPGTPIEVLFYGSFIALQGAEVIVDAARAYRGPALRWVLLGNGPLLETCKQNAQGLTNVVFENWLPYAQLPARIRHADILLGVFGTTPKAQRVIPNKVFQALACGKPLVTCRAPAYPAGLMEGGNSGITWVPAGDSAALAARVAELAHHPERFATLGRAARSSYEKFFSADAIRRQLQLALAALPLTPARG
ncbi:MAG: glycosyltransferase [Pseudomonadota bacterium]